MKSKANKCGFTLVEIMIEVAIIGILGAIAISQFAQYRLRGFNSAAHSDIRNLITTQETVLFTDWKVYGVTNIVAAAGAGDGVILRGGVAATPVVTAAASGANRTVSIGINNGVDIVAHTSDGTAAQASATFVAAAKHFRGDTIYAVDADSPTVYHDPLSAAVGITLAITHIPQTAILSLADNLNGYANFVIK